jgi:hypothetical protein
MTTRHSPFDHSAAPTPISLIRLYCGSQPNRGLSMRIFSYCGNCGKNIANTRQGAGMIPRGEIEAFGAANRPRKHADGFAPVGFMQSRFEGHFAHKRQLGGDA